MNTSESKTVFKIFHILKRATGGFRQRPLLHFFSTITLAAAFLSFAATLTVAINLNSLIDKWTGTTLITVYLKNGTNDKELEKLKIAVLKIEGVESASSVTSKEAKQKFIKDLSSFSDSAGALSNDSFPASIDINLSKEFSSSEVKRKELAARLSKVNMIDDVELYNDWFSRLKAIGQMGHLAAWGLGLLAAIVSILVVAATIRQGVTSRKKEISVMRFVGATETYVKMPFLLEGAVESLIAMILALISLNYLMNYIISSLRTIMPLLGGNTILRINSTLMFYLLAGGILAGLTGAVISLRNIKKA
ncbi:MAG: hypothetical protein JXR91_14730 [Deltaproteobacteria bacterium]|nr:hypothetical protein [Deltaproteobacteria bacterium]